MTPRLAIFPLISAAWGGAARSLAVAAPWLVLFALAAGLYSFALRSESGLWFPLGAAILAFLAGTELSRRVYQRWPRNVIHRMRVNLWSVKMRCRPTANHR